MSTDMIQEKNDAATRELNNLQGFNDLMAAINTQLDYQFSKSRLAGDKYADVFLGSMQYAMQTSVQLLLGEAKANKEVELLEAQRLQTIAATEKIRTEISKIKNDNVLVLAKIKTETSVQAKLAEEKALLQIQKELLQAKINTEKAQATGPAPKDGTVLGAQVALYDKQKDSFERNAEQKYLKTVLDAWSVNANVMGVGMCKVGAFQAHGLDSIIREIGSKVDVSVPGPDGGACDDGTS